MSDSIIPRDLPAAEDLTPREARDMTARVQTAIGAGSVRETPRIDGYLDRLQVAAQLPNQAQRDAARQVAPAAASAPAQASQRQQQADKPAAARL